MLCRLPRWLYTTDLLAVVGFPSPSFWSTDYFPLLPWFFLFCAGYFLWSLLDKSPRAKELLRPGLRPLSFLGRHSLWLFFVHHMDVFTSAIWQKDRLLFTLPCRIGWDILLSLLLLGCWTLLRTGWRRLTAK